MIKVQPEYYPLYKTKKPIIIVTGGRGSAKCLKKGTNVIMADLSLKPIEEIKVGDSVMGDNYNPVKVLSTTKGYGQLVTVKQTSGIDYVTNTEHILTLKKSEASKKEKSKTGRLKPRYTSYSDIIDISVLEFADKSKRFRENFRGFKVNSIPYKESNVLIPPYLLGLWLGDGTSIFPQITTADEEIYNYLLEYADENNFTITINGVKGKAKTYRIRKNGGIENLLMANLRKYNLINNKHIPQCYISNSEEYRLQLLAGLLDTDGTLRKGNFYITQKSERLAKQIKYIADSLGFRTSINTTKGICSGKYCGLYYRVVISGDIWKIPCKIKRKQITEEQMSKNKDWHLSYITIEQGQEIGEWYGIAIGGNHRFLLEDGTVTHNSFNASTFIERLTFEKGHKILFSRYTMVSAGLSIIPEFKEKIELEGTGKYFIFSNNTIINKSSGSSIIFRGIKTSSGNQTANLKSIQGLTDFVGDEMEEWTSEDDFEKLILSIRQKDMQLRVILILNPADSNHFLYKKYIENNYKLIKIDGVDVQISTHPDVEHIHTTYLDNKENLNEQFLNQVENIKKESIEKCTINGVLNQADFNKSKYALKIVGRWSDIAEGVIFTNWEEGDFDTSISYCYGQDYGFSVDPDTLIKVAVNIKKKIIYVDELYYGCKQLSTDDLFILNKSNIDKYNDLIVGDSSEPRLIADLKKKGLNIEGCYKSAGSVSASITKMLDYKIIVTTKSVNIKSELRKYAWNDKKSGIPIDKDNHTIDSIRYAFDKLTTKANNNLASLASMI